MTSEATATPIFEPRRLSTHDYKNRYSGHHYDAIGYRLGDVMQPAFFNVGWPLLKPGDTIMVSAEDMGALLYVKSSSSYGVVVRVMASSEP